MLVVHQTVVANCQEVDFVLVEHQIDVENRLVVVDSVLGEPQIDEVNHPVADFVLEEHQTVGVNRLEADFALEVHQIDEENRLLVADSDLEEHRTDEVNHLFVLGARQTDVGHHPEVDSDLVRRRSSGRVGREGIRREVHRNFLVLDRGDFQESYRNL